MFTSTLLGAALVAMLPLLSAAAPSPQGITGLSLPAGSLVCWDLTHYYDGFRPMLCAPGTRCTRVDPVQGNPCGRVDGKQGVPDFERKTREAAAVPSKKAAPLGVPSKKAGSSPRPSKK